MLVDLKKQLDSARDALIEYAKSKACYRCHALPEHTHIEGNVMASGDDDYDKECEKRVYEQLNAGNEWAWCTVCVEAYVPILQTKGVNYLGCCSYENGRDFAENSGYFEDMCEAALADLIANIEKSFDDMWDVL